MSRRASHPAGLSPSTALRTGLSKPLDSRFRGNDRCGSSGTSHPFGLSLSKPLDSRLRGNDNAATK